MSDQQEILVYKWFRIGVLLKGANALLEIVGGVLLLFASPSIVTQLVVLLTQEELSEDPHDHIANYLLHVANGYSVSTQIFGAVYLLIHGIVKIVLVWELLKNKLWAYPSALAVFGLFIFYQVYRFSITHSLGLVALTLFDLVVMWLIWREYRVVRVHPSSNAGQL